MTVNRSDFQKQLMSGVTATDKIIVLDDGGTDEPGVVTAANLAGSAPFTSTLVTSSTLTTDGDVLTRTSGAPARITRADLAQDSAFSSRYASATDFPSGAFTSFAGMNPVSTGGTITTFGSNECYYLQLGKLVVCKFRISIVTQGTATGFVDFTLPVTARNLGANLGGSGVYREVGVDAHSGFVILNSTTVARLAKVTNGSPLSGDGSQFRGILAYEAA